MKAKLKFIIPIVFAVAAIIIAALCINFTPQERADVSSLMSTAQKYLIENQYEQAIAEFNKVIEIEPKNVDAYLGLAEAYVGMGDTEKAIEWLEKGYALIGDERLKEMLDRLLPPVPEETTVTTTAVTEETTTASTVEMVTVPDLSGFTEEEAIAACESVGLNYSVSYAYSDTVEKGCVMGQTIPANASVAEGTSVSFTVSEGAETVTAATTTTTETTTITTAPVTIVAKDIEEAEYDDKGALLYKKRLTVDGYELDWYFSDGRNIKVTEKYNNKNNLLYAGCYSKSDQAMPYAEGVPKVTNRGYIVDGEKTKDGKLKYEIGKNRNKVSVILLFENKNVEIWYYDDEEDSIHHNSAFYFTDINMYNINYHDNDGNTIYMIMHTAQDTFSLSEFYESGNEAQTIFVRDGKVYQITTYYDNKNHDTKELYLVTDNSIKMIYEYDSNGEINGYRKIGDSNDAYELYKQYEEYYAIITSTYLNVPKVDFDKLS